MCPSLPLSVVCLSIVSVQWRVEPSTPLNGKKNKKNNSLTMKLPEMTENAFDVALVLASVSCMAYFMFRAADAFVVQGNHLLPV